LYLEHGVAPLFGVVPVPQSGFRVFQPCAARSTSVGARQKHSAFRRYDVSWTSSEWRPMPDYCYPRVTPKSVVREALHNPLRWSGPCRLWPEFAERPRQRRKRDRMDNVACVTVAGGTVDNQARHGGNRRRRKKRLVGRRTSLRGWRSQDRGGSNPPFRTNNLRRVCHLIAGQPVK
jgi:hypothetical protein